MSDSFRDSHHDDRRPQKSGFGGPAGHYLPYGGDDITHVEDSHDWIGEENDKSHNTYSLLNDLFNELAEKIGLETHKITTPAPQKPGKRERVFKHGEWILKPIPLLQTNAMADFVNDPLVPHAYLVKTA